MDINFKGRAGAQPRAARRPRPQEGVELRVGVVPVLHGAGPRPAPLPAHPLHQGRMQVQTSALNEGQHKGS